MIAFHACSHFLNGPGEDNGCLTNYCQALANDLLKLTAIVSYFIRLASTSAHPFDARPAKRLMRPLCRARWKASFTRLGTPIQRIMESIPKPPVTSDTMAARFSVVGSIVRWAPNSAANSRRGAEGS